MHRHFQRFVSDEAATDATLLDECERVRTLFNDQCKMIHQDFNNTTPYLRTDWTFVSKWKHP